MDEERLGLFLAAKMRRVIGSRRDANLIFFDEDEVHHLTRVLRLGEGAEFEAILPPATRCRCRLRRVDSGWAGDIVAEATTTWESPLRICLVQSLIKGDKFEWVLQKAVELGVAEVQPMSSHRTEVSLTDRRRDRRMTRWTRILREAVKQCGRTEVPILHEPRLLAEVLEVRRGPCCVYLDEGGRSSLEELLDPSTQPQMRAVFIGPEGGWDEKDRTLFERAEVPSVRLGPRILRTETAAISILSILQFRLGDLAASPAGFSVDYRPPTH